MTPVSLERLNNAPARVEKPSQFSFFQFPKFEITGSSWVDRSIIILGGASLLFVLCKYLFKSSAAPLSPERAAICQKWIDDNLPSSCSEKARAKISGEILQTGLPSIEEFSKKWVEKQSHLSQSDKDKLVQEILEEIKNPELKQNLYQLRRSTFTDSIKNSQHLACYLEFRNELATYLANLLRRHGY